MSVLPKQPAPVWMVVVTGCGAIILYAVLAALQILALNPLAAVPGAGLSEIYGGISQAGESPGIPLTLTVLGGGIVLALVLASVLLWNRATPLGAALAYLFMLALGAPALFIASSPAATTRGGRWLSISSARSHSPQLQHSPSQTLSGGDLTKISRAMPRAC